MAIPHPRSAGPVILITDTATFGSFFVAALVLFERGGGVLAALTVSPPRSGEDLDAKVAILPGLSVVSAVPIALAAFSPSHHCRSHRSSRHRRSPDGCLGG